MSKTFSFFSHDCFLRTLSDPKIWRMRTSFEKMSLWIVISSFIRFSDEKIKLIFNGLKISILDKAVWHINVLNLEN